MTESKRSSQKSLDTASAASQLIENAMQAVHGADEAAARLRTQELRAAYPGLVDERLVEMLIQKKCMQTGMVGAVTSGAAIFPGVGTVATLTLGTLTDIGMSLRMQAELVLEIAEVYGYKFDGAEKRNALLVVTGASVGVEELISLGGKRLAQKASARVTQRSILKAIPLVGIGAAAGTNMLSTYIIGKRANAYFKLGAAAVGDWTESLRAVSGVDERKLARWLGDLRGQVWQGARNKAQSGAAKAGNLLGAIGGSAYGTMTRRHSSLLTDSPRQRSADSELSAPDEDDGA